MEFPKFSVLMSLYIKEKPGYLDASLESIINQTVKPNEIVLVYDGPISNELKDVVNIYRKANPGLFVVLENPVNKGLGLALADGVPLCSNELIARMDSDDISCSDRFEKQLKVFMSNSDISICGGYILEFEGNKENIVAQRRVPLRNNDIIKYQKRRDAFNHVSVMFKKSAVLAAGNYQTCLFMEDTLLWANMFMNGAIGMNIDDYLVYVRIGSDMYERRGGFEYFKKYKAGRKKVLETGFINLSDYYVTILIQFIVSMIPNKMRGLFFKKILHH